jgi:hypothetical protein
MLTDSAQQDTPIAQFALSYMRHHHPDICLEETDRPVDPGAEIPNNFLTFERVQPLFHSHYVVLRHYALEIARWELARWSPSIAQIIDLCDNPYKDVREFIYHALLDPESAENKRFRLDASQLPIDAVYCFCESKQAKTRGLGMELIKKYEKFQVPEALFRLTESADRQLRTFVVRILGSLYRHYSTTSHWQPHLAEQLTLGKKNQQKAQLIQNNLGTGLPVKPASLPANLPDLEALLKRWLYEIPPGRLTKDALKPTLKPLSAGQAKKALIETMRDLALDNIAFAQRVLPLLITFTRSRGITEQAACLVAVTRIQQCYPQLVSVIDNSTIEKNSEQRV